MSSMSALVSVLKRELFSASKKTPLKTLVTILVVFVLEKVLTTTNIFKCPEKGYHVYGGMFLLAPAFCLAGLTLLTTGSFWDLARSHFRAKQKKILRSKIFYDLAKAFLVGVAWLVLAFGTTDFYVCFRIGTSESNSRREEMKAQSTMVAWGMLVAIIGMGLISIAMKKCCCPHHDRECTLQALEDYERQANEACFPLGEFVRTNREKKQLDWLATNTDDVTTQSHSYFACSREKIAKWKTRIV